MWTVTRRFTEVDLALFAGATWNPHLIHLNPEVARASGLPGLVVQSHLVPAALLAALDERLASGRPILRSVHWRNRAPVTANQDVVYSVSCPEAPTDYQWEARVGDTTVATGAFVVAT